MLQIILLLLTLLACIYAIYTDFRYRYIDTWMTNGLLIIGLVANLGLSIYLKDYKPFVYSSVGALAVHSISYLRYYFGELGGGDVRMFRAIAATLPLAPAILSPQLGSWPFSLTVFVNIILLGVAYHLIYLIYKAVAHAKEFSKEFISLSKKEKKWFFVGAGISVIPFLGFLFSKLVFVFLFLALIYYWIFLLLYIFSKSVEKVMTFTSAFSKVEEGDKPIADIFVDGKLIYKMRRIGLITEDLNILRALEKQGKLQEVRFKDGVPYAPAFLLGILFSIVVGDIFIILFRAVV